MNGVSTIEIDEFQRITTNFLAFQAVKNWLELGTMQHTPRAFSFFLDLVVLGKNHLAERTEFYFQKGEFP
jgi:hypothetical protein